MAAVSAKSRTPRIGSYIQAGGTMSFCRLIQLMFGKARNGSSAATGRERCRSNTPRGSPAHTTPIRRPGGKPESVGSARK